MIIVSYYVLFTKHFFEQLKLLMNNDTYENSHFATYDGFTRFMNGDCKYIIGFTLYSP